MNRRTIAIVVTVILGLVTVVLAAGTIAEFRAARGKARARLPEIETAAAAAFVDLVDDAAAALREWDGSSEPLAPLDRIESFGFTGRDHAAVAVGASGATVRVQGNALVVEIPRIGGSTGLRGYVPVAALGESVLADERLGRPADPAGDVAGHYSRLELVAGSTTDVLWAIGPPEADAPSSMGSLPGFSSDVGKPTRARRAIERGRGSDELRNDGDGVEYKDGGGEKTFGVWRPLDASGELWLVVEVQESAATMGFAGLDLRDLGIPMRKHIFAWHLTLALTVIALLLSAFLTIQRRGIEMDLLFRVFRFVKPYKRGAFAVILLGLLFTALNATVKVFFVKTLIDDVLVDPQPGAEAQLWTLGGAVCVIAFVIAGLGYGKEYLYNWYATAIMSDIRYAIGQKIVSLPLSYFNKMRAGDLVARIERDAASMRKVFNQAFGTAVIDPFDLALSFMLAFVTSWRLALVLIGMPIIVVPLFRIAKRIKKRAEKRQVLMADISHVIFQMLIGIKVVKAFGGEEREASRLRDAITRFMAQARRIHRLSALSDALLDLLQLIGAAIVMVGGGYLVIGGAVTVGEISSFLVIIQRIYKSSKQLTQLANSMVDSAPGVRRVFEVLDAESDLIDGEDLLPKRPLIEGIRFDNVSFAYGEKRVLDRVTLDIPAGKVVAVVGPTGAGKTTLCDLVARFYDATEGAVRYDGVDVRTFRLRSLLESVAIVTQDAFLFNSTIADNILYGNPDATPEQMRAAAADAFVHDEIERMEGKYQKLAGERGGSVSGGQRQRITIARAILKDAPVLILDEATSALDSHAEQQVQAALEKLMRGRTVIVVAHRLSTIRNADKVVVMADGRVVEQGPPDELLQRPNGHFKRMYELQMGSADSGDSGGSGADEGAA